MRLPHRAGSSTLTAALSLALAMILGACSAGDDAGGDSADATAIVCSASYRVSVQEPLTEVDALRFEDVDAEQSLPYIYLELHGALSTGRADGERALRVWVTRTTESEPLVTQLYQLPEGAWPEDQFVGGHGFTGLTYAYDPVSGAELQYWCSTE